MSLREASKSDGRRKIAVGRHVRSWTVALRRQFFAGVEEHKQYHTALPSRWTVGPFAEFSVSLLAAVAVAHETIPRVACDTSYFHAWQT